MSVEGMWKFQSGSIAQPEVLQWGGVVVLETNRVFGGDSVMAYLGKFEVDRETVIAKVRSWRWNNDVGETINVFGMAGPVDYMVDLRGQRDGDVITGHISPEIESRLQLPIRMEKIADLP